MITRDYMTRIERQRIADDLAAVLAGCTSTEKARSLAESLSQLLRARERYTSAVKDRAEGRHGSPAEHARALAALIEAARDLENPVYGLAVEADR